MRLTLRTLLAHEHGLLNEQQAELISQKIEQSPFVAQLLRHLKDRSARREVVPLAIEARGTVSLEKVTRYLDYTLPAEEVVKLENECFASDRLLAEVAACHEIISQWLSTPTPTEPALRQRLYAIMPGPIGAISSAEDEIAIDLPALAYDSTPPATPVAEAKRPPSKTSAKSSWVGGAFRLTVLAASVLALVTFATMNRDKVESLLAQHWQGKSHAASAPLEAVQPSPVDEMISQSSLPSQAASVPPVDRASPIETVPALLPEVATTAFHMPIPIKQASADVGSWEIESAHGTFHQRTLDETWQTGRFTNLSEGRIVVSPGGQLQLAGKGRELRVLPLSEISLGEDTSISLRYGSLLFRLEAEQEITVNVAGQEINILSRDHPVQLALCTKAVVSRGIDFAESAANQEANFEAIDGKAELTIPGCRGPIPLNQGQIIVANMNSGVRGGEISLLGPMFGEISVSPLAEAIQESHDPIDSIRSLLGSETPGHRCCAAISLAQLGYAEGAAFTWGQGLSSQLLESSLGDIQSLLAQDAVLASEMRAVLSQSNPQHGQLVYRLICGFSNDQLTDETRLQLENLLRHPDPAVQAWAQFQLSPQ